MLYRSEYIKQELNPTWQPFTLRLRDIPNGLDGKIIIKCYDWDGTGVHDLIGKVELKVREISFGETQVRASSFANLA